MKTEEQIKAELRGIDLEISQNKNQTRARELTLEKGVCTEALYVLSLGMTADQLRANLAKKREQIEAINKGVEELLSELGMKEGLSLKYATAEVKRKKANYIQRMGKESAERSVTILNYLLS